MSWRAIQDYACESETLAELSDFEERLFFRILATSDSHGRRNGETRVVRTQCAGLLSVTDEEVDVALDTLEAVGLVQRYEDGGRTALAIVNFDAHQPNELIRRRGESRFSEPPTLRSSPEDSGSAPEDSRLEKKREEKKREKLRARETDEASEATRQVVAILTAIDKPGYAEVTIRPDRIEKLLAGHQDVDAIREAHALVDWELYGRGKSLRTKDGVARFRNWLGRASKNGTWSLPSGPPHEAAGEEGPQYPPPQTPLEELRAEITSVCERDPSLDYTTVFETAVREAHERGDLTDAELALTEVAA